MCRAADGASIAEVLVSLTEEHGVDDLPLLAFGASSGASFVSSEAFSDALQERGLGLAGYISQIGIAAKIGPLVPTVLTHMPAKDPATAARIVSDSCS